MTTYEKAGPSSLEDLLAPLPREIQEVATRLRSIVNDSLPQADETVSGGAKMGMVLYSIKGPKNVICGIQPTDSMCKLFFHGWEQIKEAGYRLEGSGKHARHIKIRSTQEIKANQIGEMIKIASKAI